MRIHIGESRYNAAELADITALTVIRMRSKEQARRLVSHPVEAASFFPAGIWRVRRKVVDHMAGQQIVFEGMATITGDTFVEQGEVVADGRALPAIRRYRLQRSGSATEVLFSDGRPFATFGELPNQRVEHHCGDDLYAGRFLFIRPDFWVEFWRVRGPRKRYISLTQFERLPGGALSTASR